MNMKIINKVTKFQTKKKIPFFKSGDIICVNVFVKEEKKTRIQSFIGTVIKKKGNGISKTFTVRKSFSSYFIDRNFPLYSPLIKEIKILKKCKKYKSKFNIMKK